ncbi:hypothetical protein GNI_154070 [Gregarina niphandrodes]|uniref:Transmembrane protein n=1 Tax=Gregarina niphandrodes TaxID=110365 RepID=A0A023AZQ9_GRENI|nr:hypothetical protein GNI_154070 [Gregarina niphandrodes]EZG44012.1 hypothetical protein GNI_154070 [Gregarina niphandrodes]|eukprot:XP_011132845.1 hypothetical protein GNI_154070 [Gregarina niphandrodes]
MRALKSGVSGVAGSELLLVLMCPDGSRAELDDCVARVVTLRVGGGDVKALVLAPKSAFEIELDGEETLLETVVVEGADYNWFGYWHRLMVWWPKGGPPVNKRAEAALLATLRRRMARRGTWGDSKSAMAVDELCTEVFGSRLIATLSAMAAALNDGVKTEVTLGEAGYEIPGETEHLGDPDDVAVFLTRPVNSRELQELLPMVPAAWMPVLERSAVLEEIPGNNLPATDLPATDLPDVGLPDVGLPDADLPDADLPDVGLPDAGLLATNLPDRDLEAARPRSCFRRPDWQFMVMGGVVACTITGVMFLRLFRGPQPPPPPRLSSACPAAGDPRTALFWTKGGRTPQVTCGDGVLVCRHRSLPTRCREFGSPWAVPFPRVWQDTKKLPFDRCSVRCNSPEETSISIASRLLAVFPSHINDSEYARSEQGAQEILNGLYLHTNCSGSASSWEEVSSRPYCRCDMADVTCEVMTTSHKARHNVTLTDLNTATSEVSNAFEEYRDFGYNVNGCAYRCFRWIAPGKKTTRSRVTTAVMSPLPSAT